MDSLNHCITHKGLEVYAWVIMTNHLHLIISSNKEDLSDIIRDFKKFTSKKLVEAIEQNKSESRSRWLLWLLKKKEGDTESITLWQPGNHPEEIRTPTFFKQKMQYIHQNPVRAGWVTNEEEYKWGSAGYFYGRGSAVQLCFYNG